MKKLKSIIKIILPKKVRLKLMNYLVLILNYIYDFKRFIKYSGTDNIYRSKGTLEGMIIHTYHSLEKGLSLKHPKEGFGKEKAEQLVQLVKVYIENFGFDETTETSLNTLEAYLRFQSGLGIDYNHIKEEVERLNNNRNLSFTDEGGYKIVKREEIIENSKINFKDFAFNRYSIRTYESKDVEDRYIIEAVNIAKKTPSVCNRQTNKVYVFSDEDSKNNVLQYQNGNKGFGDSASKILLVTSDLSLFHGTIERNQAFIDGGLFSMSLLYALHSLGLGACSLNCSLDYFVDKKLRKAAGIKDSESIIMMISVGWIPEEVKVAHSHRRSTEELVIFK